MDNDPTVEKLMRVLTELTEHKKRLDLRAKDFRARAEAAQDPTHKLVLEVASELLAEQVDTGLDFQVELIETIVKELQASGGSGAAAVDDDGEGEIEIGIEADQADTILVALNGYRAMLDAYMEGAKQQGAAPADVASLQTRKKECLEAIELVEELAFEADEGDGGDDEGDAEAQQEAPSEPN